jgi:hypothetical protein
MSSGVITGPANTVDITTAAPHTTPHIDPPIITVCHAVVNAQMKPSIIFRVQTRHKTRTCVLHGVQSPNHLFLLSTSHKVTKSQDVTEAHNYMWSLFATSRGWLSLELGHHTVVVCGALWDGAAARVLLPFVPVVLEDHPSFRVRIGPHTRPRTASSGIPITIVPRTRHCGRPVGGARRRTVNLHRQVVLELVSCGRSRTITVVRICTMCTRAFLTGGWG